MRPRPFAEVIAPWRNDAIALNESLWEPDAQARATAEGWRKYREGNITRPQVGVDWGQLKQFTGYTREDLIGFAIDEELPTVSGKLTPHQAKAFRDIVLCNWAVIEGHFSEHRLAAQALADLRRMLPWTVADRTLCESWREVCTGALKRSAASFYLEEEYDIRIYRLSRTTEARTCTQPTTQYLAATC